MPGKPRQYTTQEAADILQANVKLVNRWIADGRLPATRFGHIWMISAADLERFERPVRKPWKAVKEALP